MIYVFLTIAQHRKGFRTQLRNIQWALRDIKHKIHIQTFKKWNLPFDNKSEVDAPPYEHYKFYDDPKQIAVLRTLADLSDGMLFMQSDILFHQPIVDQANLCCEGNLITNLNSTYLSLFKRLSDKLKMVQPRIWEGGMFIPSSIVASCIDRGISFGLKPRMLKDEGYLNDCLKESLTTLTEFLGKYTTVHKYTRNTLVDTMFEVNFDCYLHKHRVLNFAGEDNKYRWGQRAIHVAGVDHLLRNNQTDLDQHTLDYFKNLNGVRTNKTINGSAFLHLLCGSLNSSIELAKVLNMSAHKDQPKIIQKHISLLEPTASEWMSKEEYRRFLWAKRVVC